MLKESQTLHASDTPCGILATKKSSTHTPGRKKSISALERHIECIPDKEKAILLRQLERDPLSRGRTQYKRFLNGEKLQKWQAILAKRYDCDGGHSDGRYDCEVPSCPLRPFMPYRGKISPVSNTAGQGVRS